MQMEFSSELGYDSFVEISWSFLCCDIKLIQFIIFRSLFICISILMTFHEVFQLMFSKFAECSHISIISITQIDFCLI